MFQWLTVITRIYLCVAPPPLTTDAPLLSTVTESDAESFLSPSGRIAACAREAHNVFLQASRLPWWKTLGDTTDVDTPPPPAHVQEKEAELGRLCTGGLTGVSKRESGNTLRWTDKPLNQWIWFEFRFSAEDLLSCKCKVLGSFSRTRR